MLEFMAKRINVQLARLKKRNANAFMFVDEPGLMRRSFYRWKMRSSSLADSAAQILPLERPGARQGVAFVRIIIRSDVDVRFP